MDLVSVGIGFLGGIFTGAAGTYFGNKYTDIRRNKEARKAEMKLWKELELKFPLLIQEMKDDFASAENHGVRKFFVKTKHTVVNRSEPSFEYHTDVHSDLSAAMLYLEDLGLIEDITPANCPMYRFKERFVDYLKGNA
ncbi:hypothetical protein [Thalassotalea marina]|uniref:Uncharacterized protein n=1 Tax=Thalassotalea marina TaxID=1673741 RepID=A0A919EMY4_9GAMM|nr:hypothetical protein [Thalassotalea marina]GHF97274.1 hypothetical protein GCM10017161_26780 [Thalassotalea marina]